MIKMMSRDVQPSTPMQKRKTQLTLLRSKTALRQRSAEQTCSVRDNSVHSEIPETVHLARRVHRPHQHSSALIFNFPNQLHHRQFVMDDHVFEGQLLPSLQLRFLFADEPKRNGRIEWP